jgi:hypothetical protein
VPEDRVQRPLQLLLRRKRETGSGKSGTGSRSQEKAGASEVLPSVGLKNDIFYDTMSKITAR